MPTNAQLKATADALDALTSAHDGNPTEAGYWRRIALALEEGAGAATAANPTREGWMLRAALAAEVAWGGSGAEENRTYEGLLKRIVDAMELNAGAGTGSLGNRLAAASAGVAFTSMFVWTVNRVKQALSNPVVTGGAPDYDFAKTAVADAWDQALFSTETLAGDCDIEFVWNDLTAAANLTIGFAEDAPINEGAGYAYNADVLHGLYCQTGLAFRHVDAATPFDTLISGIQIGDTVRIMRRGGNITATTVPARTGSPLAIKAGAAVNPYRIVFTINRVGFSLNNVGFGPLETP